MRWIREGRAIRRRLRKEAQLRRTPDAVERYARSSDDGSEGERIWKQLTPEIEVQTAH